MAFNENRGHESIRDRGARNKSHVPCEVKEKLSTLSTILEVLVTKPWTSLDFWRTEAVNVRCSVDRRWDGESMETLFDSISAVESFVQVFIVERVCWTVSTLRVNEWGDRLFLLGCSREGFQIFSGHECLFAVGLGYFAIRQIDNGSVVEDAKFFNSR